MKSQTSCDNPKSNNFDNLNISPVIWFKAKCSSIIPYR